MLGVLVRAQQNSVQVTEMVSTSLKLSEIIAGVTEVSVREVIGDTNICVTDITHDSQKVVVGSLFCCVVGERMDGHDFVKDAIKNGASALLVERQLDVSVPQIVVEDVRTAMGFFAAELFGRPSDQMIVVGVTGTNGKTTTSHLLAAILNQHGWPTAVFGTLSSARTTPESTDLQRSLAHEASQGRKAVVMEVSSHALVLGRVEGTSFRATVFTNLGQDHLDFHNSMESYFAAKAQLFTAHYSQIGVINRDDVYGRLLLDTMTIDPVTYAMSDASEISADVAHLSFCWRGEQISISIGGYFNVMNALAAASAAAKLGVAASDIAKGLAAATAVPGRFESLCCGQDFAVVVDRAVTAEALRAVLLAARELVNMSGRVIVVFGCGGDRDQQKRPKMGQVAAELADIVFITNDNPRSENPQVIANSIRSGVSSSHRAFQVGIVLDRRDAITEAIKTARKGDIVVIAGKGNESTQTIGSSEIDFNDVIVAKEVLEAVS